MKAIDLSGKVALVTGSSQGLGAAIARALHEAGASLAINYFPDSAGINEANARRLADSLDTDCKRAAIFAGDVSDPASAEGLCREAHGHFGALDIAVNNAGIARDRTLAKMSDEDWHAVIGTNLTGTFHICRAAAPLLREGGRIVNVASISALVGLFGQANYAAAKAGVIGLTRTLSRELARRAITVNAVAPGLVLTELGKTVPETIREQWIPSIPLGRFGEPEEIANAVLFLSSPLASYITGQTLQVNGGWHA